MILYGRQRRRWGATQATVVVAGVSLLVLVVLIYFALRPSRPSIDTQKASPSGTASTEKQPLLMFCAASNKPVVERVVKDFAREVGIEVQVQYGPSQTLLSNLEVSQTGDLYLPADASYLDLAATKDLTREVFPLAVMQGVVAVAKGNPKGIHTYDDLLRADVRVSLANADAAAISKLCRELLTAQGKWDQLAERTQSFKTTVNDVANDVKIGAADAGIIFDSVAAQYPDLETVSLPELQDLTARVSLAVTSTSEAPTVAIQFARYLSAEDRGLAVYQEMGYQPAQGDIWEAEPEVKIYAGSMLRPAVEKTIQDFERREGVRVTRVYNGCGILVGMMQTGDLPDAYFACDQEFMNQVQKQFPASEPISSNQLVILVPKGNPQHIESLEDLTRPDLRVGIGHEKQCAMGWLTQKTLDAGGLTTQVMKNVTVQTPTGDMLVNQLRAGSLDAAVAYLSNAAGAADFLDAIRIDGIPCAIATQPYGISATSKHQQIMQRLLTKIKSVESKQRFLLEGFQWKEGTTTDDSQEPAAE